MGLQTYASLRQLGDYNPYKIVAVGSSPTRSTKYGVVAQLVEHVPEEHSVSSSILFGPTKYMPGYTVSSSRVDCKSTAFGFGWCDSITWHQMPLWWNWYTRSFEVAMVETYRAGSSPVEGTKYAEVLQR